MMCALLAVLMLCGGIQLVVSAASAEGEPGPPDMTVSVRGQVIYCVDVLEEKYCYQSGLFCSGYTEELECRALSRSDPCP